MKILMVNTYDRRGGAARATWRLFNGIREQGIDIKLAVQERVTEDKDILRVSSPVTGRLNPLRPYIDFAIPFLQTRRRVLFSTSLLPDTIGEVIDCINPDIVHLNWITGGFLKLESLASIRKPVVWTLHDMWAFTGGCHYTGECRRYLDQCGQCPVLHSSRDLDLSRRVFARKSNVFSTMDHLTITTPSRWLAERVRESRLLGNKPVNVVPNGLDTSVYVPGSTSEIRRRLGFSESKRLILFGAIRGVQNPLKGFRLLAEATRHLDPAVYELVVFGSHEKENSHPLFIPARFMGPVHDEGLLVSLYGAADVVAVPSVQEVFGQAATEALACGIPVAAFDATGLKDIVVHEKTGYLAQPFDPEDLARGIKWITVDPDRYRVLAASARDRAVSTFSVQAVARQMTGVYREVLDGR